MLTASAPNPPARVSKTRLYVLVFVLVLTSIGLFYTRSRYLAPPPEPPKNASPPERMRLYLSRIKSDNTDVCAYIELGKLEEEREYYMSALRRLYAARALGAPEREIVLPLGRSLMHLARYDEAITNLTAAAKEMPDSADAVSNLAGAYFASGNGDVASRVLKEFVARHRIASGGTSLTSDDLHRVMLCLAEARDVVGAGDVARIILASDPNDASSLSILGHSLLLRGKNAEAVDTLKRAVSLEPTLAQLCYNYGMALVQTGRDGEALKQFERAVVLNPKAKEAFLQMATVYQKRLEVGPAALAMNHAAALAPQEPPILYRAGKANERAGKLPEANYWYAKAALAAGQRSEALKYAGRLLGLHDPRWYTDGFLLQAEAYRGLHRLKDYVDSTRKAVKGDSAGDCIKLAEAYEKSDLLAREVEYLKRALRKDPNTAALVHTSIADTLTKRQLPDEAEREMELAVAANPSDPEGHMELGNLYFQRRSTGDRLRKAIAAYEECVRLAPKLSTAHQTLGIAYSAAGNLPMAAFHLEHAIDLEPGYGPAYQELGRVYAAMGDKPASDAMLGLYRKYIRYDLKLQTLAARADQNKRDPEAQVDLADLQARSGDLVSAEQNYRMALRLAPGDKQIRRKHQRILDELTMKPEDVASK